jgi:beta-hydroxylase
MTILLTILTVLLVAVAVAWRIIKGLDGKQKTAIKDAINGVFESAEARGAFPRHPAFESDYLGTYPHFRLVEENYETIREECEALMKDRSKLVKMQALGGSYTTGKTHVAEWTTLMFKSGDFVEENCRLAPRTADLVRRLPGVYTAFFSVLEPHQRLGAHFGYYKGFLRYHMGVLVPNNNEDGKCWIRINADASDNARRDVSLIEKGERYCWKNGEGVVFDDTYLHEAANDSEQVRVVLWFDFRRKLPWYLDAFNRFCLFVIHHEPSVKRIRRNAIVGG